MQILKMIGILVGCLSLTVPAMAPAFAQGRPQGKAQGAKAKPQGRPQSAQARPQNKAAPSRAGYPTAKASPNINRPQSVNYNKPGNKPGNNNRPGGGGNNIGNTVVVAPPRGNNNNYNNGYNNNGYNNNGRYYEDDDNDFLEFVGKTAAITAGVSVVAAVIGSSTNDKPSDCQESMSNGQVYLNCNGTWYQPVQSGGQSSYTVVAPPK